MDGTIVESLQDAKEKLYVRRSIANGPDAAREYSLAITAAEDAIMRTNRAIARDEGLFFETDVEAARKAGLT